MKLKFIQTFSGTRGFYVKGTEIDIESKEFAQDLISQKFAIESKAKPSRKNAEKANLKKEKEIR